MDSLYSIIGNDGSSNNKSLIEAVIGIQISTINVCSGCGHTSSRDSTPFVVDLVHKGKSVLKFSKFCLIISI